MLIESLGHPEQIVRRFIEMSKDESPCAASVRDLVKEPAFGVGRAALLPALDHESTDLASKCLLLLKLAMQVVLGEIQAKGINRTALCSDPQAFGRVMGEIITQPEA